MLAIPTLTKAPARTAPQVEVAAPAMNAADRAAGSAQLAPITYTAAAVSTDTPEPTEAELTPDPTATLEPAPELAEKPADGRAATVFLQAASAGADYSDPASNQLVSMTQVYDDNQANDGLFVTDAQTADIHMGSSAEYATLEGVTTFRGSNYRDGGAYGEIPEDPSHMSVV